MNFAKNTAIASALAIVGLFSLTANAEIGRKDLIQETESTLAKAVNSGNTSFAACVDDNFYSTTNGRKPPLLNILFSKLSGQVAVGLIKDKATLKRETNELLEQVCGENRLAEDGK